MARFRFGDSHLAANAAYLTAAGGLTLTYRVVPDTLSAPWDWAAAQASNRGAYRSTWAAPGCCIRWGSSMTARAGRAAAHRGDGGWRG